MKTETTSPDYQNTDTSNRFLTLFEPDRLIVLDGAMGTMIQKAGLPLLRHPERNNVLFPEVIEGIHRQYIEAGANVIYANTFGASPDRFGTNRNRMKSSFSRPWRSPEMPLQEPPPKSRSILVRLAF